MMQIVTSLLPIVWLVVALSVLRMKAWVASAIALFIGAFAAIVVFPDAVTPISAAVTSLNGFRFALCPIGLVIISTLYVYRLCVLTGSMGTIRDTLAGASDNQILTMLLIVWGFGNFMEGIAGFGTAVAIPAAVMVSVGMDPLKAVVLCLVSNTTATAFGSIAIPMLMLAREAQLNVNTLSVMAMIPLSVGFVVTPFMLLVVSEGVSALRRHWMLCAVASVSFIVPCWLTTWIAGPELADIVGAIVSMAAIFLMRGRSWGSAEYRKFLLAALPFILVVVFLCLYALALPAGIKANLTPGAVIMCAAVVGGLVQGMTFRRIITEAVGTVRDNWRALATICAVVALARIMDKSGMISCLANALVSTTGGAYPFVAPVIGSLGGFITGSGTNSCILFGALQKSAAVALSMNAELMAAANVFGAGIGKMICPQSIAIGLAAVRLVGRESEVFKKVFPWFVAELVLAGAVCGILIVFS